MPNNTASAKLAPNQHQLTPDQRYLVARILAFTKHHRTGGSPAERM
ncbi:hypothetical protein M8332_00630 [Fructilactobacillus ixorae]|uniref:Uncharacterized protein n=1 Tax=Fructilactobacillus ixorae TaxID=1750535 RepID=A0ABY5C730_9LACO|nr:hypothetical protein [Fructilactobacillus ixorae]USS93408.1 hypothetical protein M8332_00630 [Fructilactobacillus ixorae]